MRFFLVSVRLGVLFLLWLGLFPTAWAQEVVIVTVRSFGQGMTEAAAIKDGIVEAVGRVSGERISSQSTTQTSSSESTLGTSEHSANYQQRIDSMIRGVVKSSRTLSVSRDPVAGLYKAELEVSVATFKKSEQLKRIKLALVTGSQVLPRALGAESPAFLQALVNGLSDKLVTAQKFAVLDRQQRDAAQKEFSRITSGGTPVENYVRLQSTEVADFLLVIDVSDYLPSKSILGSERAKASARAMVYDYSSGQIRQSVTATAQRILRDGTSGPLAYQLGSELAEKIIDNVFPARVIAIDDGNLIINAGLGQFEIGDPVYLSRQGKSLRDPYTQENLGSLETPVAHGVIIMVMPKVSVVQLVANAGSLDPKGSVFVVRRSRLPAPPAGASMQTSTSTKGKQNDDW